MSQKPEVIRDDHIYHLSFQRPIVQFFVTALNHYEALLSADLSEGAIPPALKALFDPEWVGRNPLQLEQKRAARIRTDLASALGQSPEDPEIDMPISHSWIRFLKSVSRYYLSYLRSIRNSAAVQGTLQTRLMLSEVDRKISEIEETLTIGIFRSAAPWPLAIDQFSADAKQVSGGTSSSPTRSSAPPTILTGIEIVDEQLRAHTLDLFARLSEGDPSKPIDTIIAEACRVVEDRVRRLSGATKITTGVNLATFAFGAQPIRLQVSREPAEQEAAHLLFRGFFGLIRNDFLHRVVEDIQPVRVLQIVAMADYLLFLADSASRLSSISSRDPPPA